MKIGVISKTNEKGQVVIPKYMRRQLGITNEISLNFILRGEGIYIYPVEEVLTPAQADNASYLEILKFTQGSWAKENWEGLRKKRKKIEKEASEKRKRKW
ncbi:AbrB/MazE/SpoVT family DNA-binding domain-containing protein [Candidatus Shapirobacteria bacterium]|nr:AbrB/MazE/SpoVT family DNA-binding domain-containing protein [Candidatus Shapirobacteria bacterium]